jgi:hypothetical protein
MRGKVHAVKHDLGAFELRAESHTVTATADGRTSAVLHSSQGGQYASGHPFRSGSGSETARGAWHQQLVPRNTPSE